MSDAISGSSDGFSSVVDRLDYPMFVVTTRAGNERSGCLVGFATQAGIDPPRFLVGLSDKNRTFRVATAADHLAVHVLDRRHLPWRRCSAGRRATKWTSSRDAGGAKVRTGCRSWTIPPRGSPVRSSAGSNSATTWASCSPPDLGELRGDLTDLVTFRDVRDIDAGHDA